MNSRLIGYSKRFAADHILMKWNTCWMTPDIDSLNLAQGLLQKQWKMSMSDKT